jgi:hypothetical protein
MARAGSVSTKRVAALLRAPEGLADSIAVLSMVDEMNVAPIEPAQVTELNAPAEVVERQIGFRYPAVSVYCEKITNSQREKFRTFSGSAKVAIEIRVTHDQLGEVGQDLHLYVEAVTRVLDANRGDWGQGMFYAGGYEVAYNAIKPGGRTYIQTAKIGVTIDINS